MVHGIASGALTLMLLLAGCQEAPKAADRPAGDQQAADQQAADRRRAASEDSVISAPSARIAVASPSAESLPAAAPTGKYVTELPAADASLRRISLDLRPDSTCVFKTEFVGKGERVESGRWSWDGALVSIVIGPPRDPSKQTTFAFAASRDSLVSAQWDTTRFGSEGLGTLVAR